MKYSAIKDEYDAEACLNEEDESVMECRAEYDRKERENPERDKVAVCKSYDAAHDNARKGHYPVLRGIGAGLGSVGEPRDHIQNAVYQQRHQYPEFNIGIYRLAHIIRQIVVDEYRHLKRYADNGHDEDDPLKFEPDGPFQIP